MWGYSARGRCEPCHLVGTVKCFQLRHVDAGHRCGASETGGLSGHLSRPFKQFSPELILDGHLEFAVSKRDFFVAIVTSKISGTVRRSRAIGMTGIIVTIRPLLRSDECKGNYIEYESIEPIRW